MLLQYGEEDILYGTLTFYLGGETVEAIAHTALDCQCHEYDASSELWHRTGRQAGRLSARSNTSFRFRRHAAPRPVPGTQILRSPAQPEAC